MREGECVRLFAGEKEDRPGVVLRLLPSATAEGEVERVLVICGTRTFRPELKHVLIRPDEPAGRALQLYAPTYFYSSGSVAMAQRRAVRSLGTRCPPEVFLRLARLVGTAR